ncbi:MAG: NADH-quinone oxidoreductase subunit NuoK [Candidatus Fervidibacter sp.]|uniref:NADH-quinone oxidoreductase subunit NuoK n=1 Tax=Candidatus Fervidibacter sp. TaxID=3100871 RepID=UPI00404B71EF
MQVTLTHYFVLSAILFAIGAYGILTRRNAIALLMCIELMLNAVNINLVAMNRFLQPDWRIVTGQIFAGFIIVLAAAEAAVGFALVITIYRHLDRINVDEVNVLKW